MENTQKHQLGDAITKPRQSSSIGLIIRQKEPNNLETPFDRVDSFLTPTELFYIRSHFPAPKLDPASYRLRIDGAVRNPFSLTYQNCGTCRPRRGSPFWNAPAMAARSWSTVEGAQWELGAVGNAQWTGVGLGALLKRAGMENDACEIVLEGADQGSPKEKPVPPGTISYARSLPRDKQFSEKY